MLTPIKAYYVVDNTSVLASWLASEEQIFLVNWTVRKLKELLCAI